MDLTKELPMGFSMALAKNTEALDAFASMTEEQRQKIIAQTHSVASKEEMESLVSSLAQKH